MAHYENRLRVRSSGVYIADNKLLMVGHKMSAHNIFWSPPGGGVQYAETARHAAVREFSEETGTVAQIGRLLYINEYLEPPLHAMELFFEVTSFTGTLRVGYDPEELPGEQVLTELRFMSLAEIKQLPVGCKHAFFDTLEDFTMNNLPLIFLND